MVIDFSAHFISHGVANILKTGNFGKDFPFPPENADPETRLRIMKKYGIDMQVLSLTTPILSGYGAKDAARICKISNDDTSDICEKYPDKFAGNAVISLLDVGEAVDELDRAIGELGLKGLTISTNQNGKGLDSAEYAPFYDKVVKYDIPIFLHPTNWESYPLVDMKKGFRLMHILGWPFDTSQATCRLIFSGTLEKYPSLKIVTHHLGAMLPYFSRRLELSFNSYSKDKLPKPLSEYLKRVYGDTALEGVAALACGYAFFGPDRMVFGTDYPFGPGKGGEVFVRNRLAAIKTMKIPKTHKAKILEINAKKLLKLR